MKKCKKKEFEKELTNLCKKYGIEDHVFISTKVTHVDASFMTLEDAESMLMMCKNDLWHITKDSTELTHLAISNAMKTNGKKFRKKVVKDFRSRLKKSMFRVRVDHNHYGIYNSSTERHKTETSLAPASKNVKDCKNITDDLIADLMTVDAAPKTPINTSYDEYLNVSVICVDGTNICGAFMGSINSQQLFIEENLCHLVKRSIDHAISFLKENTNFCLEKTIFAITMRYRSDYDIVSHIISDICKDSHYKDINLTFITMYEHGMYIPISLTYESTKTFEYLNQNGSNQVVARMKTFEISKFILCHTDEKKMLVPPVIKRIRNEIAASILNGFLIDGSNLKADGNNLAMSIRDISNIRYYIYIHLSNVDSVIRDQIAESFTERIIEGVFHLANVSVQFIESIETYNNAVEYFSSVLEHTSKENIDIEFSATPCVSPVLDTVVAGYQDTIDDIKHTTSQADETDEPETGNELTKLSIHDIFLEYDVRDLLPDLPTPGDNDKCAAKLAKEIATRIKEGLFESESCLDNHFNIRILLTGSKRAFVRKITDEMIMSKLDDMDFWSVEVHVTTRKSRFISWKKEYDSVVESEANA